MRLQREPLRTLGTYAWYFSLVHRVFLFAVSWVCP